ncbi:hypothetical protein HBO12_16825 [Pseudomonas sp. WS 5059]|uniref:hypothetical protein n=1 Tax=Pseudomonas sp. WS 5059 TaxID=2717491 RepID=UPI0014767EB8|nr:hypothetical protein [Pseudomonas sp. WS 5059]NMY04625.1 hypothetical protein [Pseudomonas sp. WS 5059]
MSGSIQSSNYVPGVSGWKIDNKTGEFEMHCAALSVVGKDEAALYSGAAVTHSPKRSIVIDGVTYINKACIKEASIKASILSSGKVVMVGVGLLDERESLADAIKGWHDRIGSALEAGGVSAAIDKMAQVVADTELGKELLVDIGRRNSGIADLVKDIIRTELMPGGLLHRSR